MTSRLEEIARIIDPEIFEDNWAGMDVSELRKPFREALLEKARTILAPPPSPDARNAALEEALSSAIDCVQKYYDTFGDLGDYATRANMGDWLDVLEGRKPHGETNAPKSVAKEAVARWLNDPAVKEAETPEAEDQDVITMPTEAFNKFREALENPKEPTEALKRLFREPTREEARALTDAGYMPVSEYVRLFGEGR